MNLLNICQNVARTVEIEKKYEKKSTERNRTNIEEIEKIKIEIFENAIAKIATEKNEKKMKKKIDKFYAAIFDHTSNNLIKTKQYSIARSMF